MNVIYLQVNFNLREKMSKFIIKLLFENIKIIITFKCLKCFNKSYGYNDVKYKLIIEFCIFKLFSQFTSKHYNKLLNYDLFFPTLNSLYKFLSPLAN